MPQYKEQYSNYVSITCVLELLLKGILWNVHFHWNISILFEKGERIALKQHIIQNIHKKLGFMVIISQN